MHTMEAGLTLVRPTTVPAQVISVPPPVYDAMEMDLVMPARPPPPYKERETLDST